MKRKKLNIGCGYDIKKGFVNADIKLREGVDVECDINKKLPFKDNEFDLVLMYAVMEYSVDPLKTMAEIHRITKHNGKVIIKVPYKRTTFPEVTAYGERSFDIFDPSYPYFGSYTNKAFKIDEIKVIPTTLGKLIPPIPLPRSVAVNLRAYVGYYLSNIVNQLIFKLVVKKRGKK